MTHFKTCSGELLSIKYLQSAKSIGFEAPLFGKPKLVIHAGLQWEQLTYLNLKLLKADLEQIEKILKSRGGT